MTRSESLLVESGQWQLEVEPARGGAVTVLRHRGRDVLVSPDPATSDAMGAANFMLVPYANRIAHGRFTHAGRQWQLPRNFGDHAHPLHGTGWKRAWAVTQQADAVEMKLTHVADAHWPWAFGATQRISHAGNVMRHELTFINCAAEPAPVGVGFHPAFAACAATRLQVQVEGVWQIDGDSLPVSLAPASVVLPELAHGHGAVAALRGQLVDHCFTGWSRALSIEHAGHDGAMMLELSASPGMDFLQLYTPPGRSWFCAEPMSQMPDAVNRAAITGTGLRMLAPGESLQVWMQIAVER